MSGLGSEADELREHLLQLLQVLGRKEQIIHVLLDIFEAVLIPYSFINQVIEQI